MYICVAHNCDKNAVTLVRVACNGNNILKFQSIAAGDFGVYRKDK